MSVENKKLDQIQKQSDEIMKGAAVLGGGLVSSFFAMAVVRDNLHNFNDPAMAGAAMAATLLPAFGSMPIAGYIVEKNGGLRNQFTESAFVAIFVGAPLMAIAGFATHHGLLKQNSLPTTDGNAPIVETTRDKACGQSTSGVGVYTDKSGKQFQVACAPEIK